MTALQSHLVQSVSLHLSGRMERRQPQVKTVGTKDTGPSGKAIRLNTPIETVFTPSLTLPAPWEDALTHSSHGCQPPRM